MVNKIVQRSNPFVSFSKEKRLSCKEDQVMGERTLTYGAGTVLDIKRRN